MFRFARNRYFFITIIPASCRQGIKVLLAQYLQYKGTNMLLDRSPARMHDSHQPNGCFWSWFATGLIL
ncbi:hypothetical protein E3J61_02500 [Candidatus Dependentiae bacterium]|nr:MAG: hypothetical protein E3J61_02500 [Candidatus Dependentiae bacterium]